MKHNLFFFLILGLASHVTLQGALKTDDEIRNFVKKFAEGRGAERSKQLTDLTLTDWNNLATAKLSGEAVLPQLITILDIQKGNLEKTILLKGLSENTYLHLGSPAFASWTKLYLDSLAKNIITPEKLDNARVFINLDGKDILVDSSSLVSFLALTKNLDQIGIANKEIFKDLKTGKITDKNLYNALLEGHPEYKNLIKLNVEENLQDAITSVQVNNLAQALFSIS